MYKPLFGLAVAAGCAASSLFAIGAATADPYKWCAVYNVGDAAYNCGFVTIEQCRATVSGIGGFCEPNQFYTGLTISPRSAAESTARTNVLGRLLSQPPDQNTRSDFGEAAVRRSFFVCRSCCTA